MGAGQSGLIHFSYKQTCGAGGCHKVKLVENELKSPPYNFAVHMRNESHHWKNEWKQNAQMCRLVVIFSSSDYWDSPYCMMEYNYVHNHHIPYVVCNVDKLNVQQCVQKILSAPMR